MPSVQQNWEQISNSPEWEVWTSDGINRIKIEKNLAIVLRREGEKELVTILAEHVGETGESESAIEVLNRILAEHKCSKIPENKT